MSENVGSQLYRRLGSTIKRLRLSAKKTQEELAREINISRASVVNIEQGRHRLQLHVLYDIAIVLGCELTDFLPAVKDLNATLPLDLDSHLKPEEKEPVAKLIRLAQSDRGGT